ncbi:unnamed protein product [Adineta ricciae]|uniref:Uncharacterized protein n=1 Tax=Adineta ricciae TaxID=249248 RepID=A0A815D212_ADIRI|nr:unnamed protein product [Adineta ricciae]CAF1589361.1 unnamed protein product [Adineta ricciae]
MATAINILPQPNMDDCVNDLLIVRLVDASSGSDVHQIKMKSGLLKIHNVRYFNQSVQRLKSDLKPWIPLPSEARQSWSEMLGQPESKSVEFNDIDECIRYIQLFRKKRIILLIFNEQANVNYIKSAIGDLANVIGIYRCISQRQYKNRRSRLFSKNKHSVLRRFAEIDVTSPTETLDKSQQAVLMTIIFLDLIQYIPQRNNAMDDFIKYCEEKYRGDKKYPQYIVEMDEFKRSYQRNAIHWFSRNKTFLNRMVSNTCAALDFDALPKVSFFLRDLYQELEKQHTEQIQSGRLRSGLTVYRGAKMMEEELNQFQQGALFVNRCFVSTTTEKNVIAGFAGEGSGLTNGHSVFLTMNIDYIDIRDKPVAHIDHISQMSDEKEVLLCMGIIFRVKSCIQTGSGLNSRWEIEMVRGEEEVKLERHASQYLNSIADSGLSVFTAMQFTTDIKDHLKSTSRTYHAPHTSTGEHQSIAVNNHNTSAQQLDNAPTSRELTVMEHLPDNPHIAIEIPEQPPSSQIVSSATTGMTFIQQAINVFAILNVLGAVPFFVHAVNDLKSSDGPPICKAVPSVQNPSPNYQVEHLYFFCSETLSNMTIIQKVQRTFNETHAQQYQTFWNHSTNMTYVENPTEIIYTWFSLPGMYIVKESFPHFIEAQFYYTANASRILGNDTWEIWVQFINGRHFHLSGTF